MTVSNIACFSLASIKPINVSGVTDWGRRLREAYIYNTNGQLTGWKIIEKCTKTTCRVYIFSRMERTECTALIWWCEWGSPFQYSPTFIWWNALNLPECNYIADCTGKNALIWCAWRTLVLPVSCRWLDERSISMLPKITRRYLSP